MKINTLKGDPKSFLLKQIGPLREILDRWQEIQRQQEDEITKFIPKFSRLIEDAFKLSLTQAKHRGVYGNEGFNVFAILKVGRYETTTHTPILADLLNPKGSHGLGVFFLNPFLEKLGVSNKENWQLKMNKSYIDIFLWRTHPDAKIIIENKIDHIDGPNQLYRYAFSELYSKYGDGWVNEEDRFRIIYLTPAGHHPSLQSRQRPKHFCNSHSAPLELPLEAVNCWSYHDDIYKWLSKCLHILETGHRKQDRIIGTIRQYIDLIRSI